MADVTFDVTAANRFISSLSKSLQALCHGCMDFDSGIEIVGYINVNIDKGSKVDYVLNEKVEKSRDNSMTFVSNSFMAKKDKPKQLRDGACSPVSDLQTSKNSSPAHRGMHRSNFSPGHSPYSPHHSQVMRGSRKRSLASHDWRARSQKFSRPSHTMSQDQMFIQNPSTQPYIDPSSQQFLPPPQSSPFPGGSAEGDAGVNVKPEPNTENSFLGETSENFGNSGDLSSTSLIGDNMFVKPDPDAMSGIPGSEESGTCGQESGGRENNSQPTDSLHKDAAGSSSQLAHSGESGESIYKNSLNNSEMQGASSTFQNPDNNSLDYYSQNASSDNVEAKGGEFECIEIESEEEQDFQVMFGDNQNCEPSQEVCGDESNLSEEQTGVFVPPNCSDDQRLFALPNSSEGQRVFVPPNSSEELDRNVRRPKKMKKELKAPPAIPDDAVRQALERFVVDPEFSTPPLVPPTDNMRQCDLCEVFVADYNMARHMAKAHQGKLPFNCHLCRKGFMTDGGLRKHLDVHQGKKFYCPLCEAKFNQKSDLKRHIEKIHRRKQCPSCNTLQPIGEEFNIHVYNCK